MTLEQATAAIEAIQALMVPAPRRATVGLLLQLWHATAKAGIGEEDLQIKVSTYAEDLAAYPADVTGAALTEARRRFKFFPSVAELLEVCEALVSKRRWLLRTLQDRIRQLQQPALSVQPALRRMPGSGEAKVGFWSVDGGHNVDRLAALRGISRRQARELLVFASPADLLALEEAVRASNAGPGDPD